MILRMPVFGENDVAEEVLSLFESIYVFENVSAVGNAQTSPLAEVVLNINNNECS